MAHKYAEILQQWSDSIQIMRDELKANTEHDLTAIRNRLDNSLKQNQLFLHSLLGQARATEKVILAPITHIMGMPIEVRKPVEPADLQPSDFEKENFLRERDELYNQFLDLTDEQIFSKAKLPGGDNVIRAVAKKAEVPDYLDAPIDPWFVERIKKSIAALQNKKNQLTEAERKIPPAKKK